MARPFDAIVIGTGFAGAVTACRLTEAGQRICVLERGRRFEASDFPVYPTGVRPSTALVGDTGEPEKRVQPDFSRLFWKLGQGLWDVRDLGDVAVAQAAGYGGGSLVYANVHLRAPADVFDHCWPDEYRRPALDPYYDLAAYMLDVAPIEENLPKTVQLERVASQQQERFRFFRPPLAVNFNSSGKNRFGRVQGTCDLRGECLFGCGAQAKNTLDLNYLAIAEDATDGKGAPLADIRTLAEVVSIEGEEKGYKVTYRDHLAGEPGNYVTVTGRYVFLCAGSVNSTELLLRSREKLSCSGPDLGARYYPNADTLAVVFDCENLQEADRGPTITAALLYDRRTQGADPLAERESAPDKPRHWFLVEDGGMPSDLEPLLGAFRSPLWLQRNRFREDESEARIPRSQGGAYGDLPFETATDIVSGLSRGAIESRPELRNAISEFLLMRGQSVPEAGADGEDRRWRLPKQLTDALVEIRDQLLEDVATAGEPLVAGFLDGAAERVESLYELDEALKDLLPDGIDPEGLEGVHLMRRALRLGLQLVWGSEGGMVGDAAHKLLELLMPEQGGVPRRITELLRWALDYRVGDGHTAVLLSMGRDSRPGRLELAAANEATASRPDRGGCPDEHENERREELRSQIEDVWKDELRQSGSPPCQMGASLRACLPGPLETPERTTQELLLRDIATGVRSNGKAARADGLQGELRTNPAWSFLDRRLTVHSQGGCPMPTFTESSGEVKGCQGLYVMDAAAFPTPVGVNPSATIAAVAEYKVERFIRERLRKKAWTAPEMTRANTWAGRRRAQLDPIGSGGRPSAPPYSKPVGIEFKEAMTGFHEKSVGDDKRFIRTDLQARIEDLAQFLERSRRCKAQEIFVTGTVDVRGLDGISDEMTVRGRQSYMRLFVDEGRTPGGRESRTIEYHLVLDPSTSDAKHGVPWILDGLKFIRDDERLDVWEDTTTLWFQLRPESGGPAPEWRRGKLELPANEFFGRQLPSFRATNTADKARQSWALAAFGRFFFGHLLDVYASELDDIVDVVKRIAGRAHV
jgi:choline dehydrogenase-like flavoprotein